MRYPVSLMAASAVILVVCMAVMVAFPRNGSATGPTPDSVELVETPILGNVDQYKTDVFDAEQFPLIEFLGSGDSGIEEDSGWKPDEDQIKIIGRMTQGIARYKNKQSGWWECGKFMSDPSEILERALFYSYEVVRAANEASDQDDDPEFVLNPWGLLGTIGNESRFDRCALGLYPRKEAYRLRLIKARRRCISHSEDEVIKAVTSPQLQAKYGRVGFDLGTTQLLSRFYKNKKDYRAMMGVRHGTVTAAHEMRKRGRLYKTNRPWVYWCGGKCDWYDKKITRWAKRLGAKPGEI